MRLIVLLFVSLLGFGAACAQELPDHHFPLLSSNYPGAYTVRGCIAEKACPVKAHALFGCGVSEESAAMRICAIVKDGRRVISPFRVVHQGDQGGGSCGAWFLVTCFDPPDVAYDGPPPAAAPPPRASASPAAPQASRPPPAAPGAP